MATVETNDDTNWFPPRTVIAIGLLMASILASVLTIVTSRSVLFLGLSLLLIILAVLVGSRVYMWSRGVRLIFMAFAVAAMSASLVSAVIFLSRPEEREAPSLQNRIAELSANLDKAASSIDSIESEINTRQNLVNRLAAD